MPERFEIYIVYKRRYINTLPFLFLLKGDTTFIMIIIVIIIIITGPPTHSVGGQTSNDRWRLSSSVVCNKRAARGGPVVSRTVMATCIGRLIGNRMWPIE